MSHRFGRDATVDGGTALSPPSKRVGVGHTERRSHTAIANRIGGLGIREPRAC